MITRHHLQALLGDYLTERREMRFAWGSQDCCTFAADWVLRARAAGAAFPPGGELDPMAGLRGLATPLQALRALRRAGGSHGAATARLGAALPGRYAAMGDVCLLRSGRRVGRAAGWAFGVCTGAHIAAPGVERLQYLPVSAAEAAWRIV